MDPVDRLAAYLAGELRADERAQLEASLSRDPELRLTLEAMRRANDALARLAAPSPPEGFDARLDAVVDATLADTLGASDDQIARLDPAADGDEDRHPIPDAGAVADDLAARRARRLSPGVFGAAAAGLVLVVGGIIAVQQMGDMGLSGDSAAENAAELLVEDDVADEPPGDDAADAPAVGETLVGSDLAIVDEGRILDADDLDALLDGDALVTLATQRLDGQEGAELAMRRQDQFGAAAAHGFGATDQDDVDHPRAEQEEAEDEAETDPDADVMADPQEAATPDAESGAQYSVEGTDVLRCLAVLLATDPVAIPAYAELATVDGHDAVVIGVVTADPDTSVFDRREIWVMDRDACDVLDTVRASPGAG